MPDRKCRTCKHYEASPIRRKGWCRNPRLYSPQQSHLVDADDLDCAHRLGNYWEPAEPASPNETNGSPPPDDVAGSLPDLPDFGEPVKVASSVGARAESSPERQSLHHNDVVSGSAPAEVVSRTASHIAGGTGMVSGKGGSAGGGASSSSGRTPGGGSSAGGSIPPSAAPPRRGGGGPPPGQERTVSYQPEERYWTDYLRVALPVVGLLLLLGLFWYWARELIGDEADSPTGTPVDVGLVNAATFTPTPTEPVGNIPVQTANPSQTQPAGASPTAEATEETGGDTGEPTPRPTRTPRASAEETPTEEAAPPDDLEFVEGDLVIVQTDDGTGINLREEPSTDGEIVTLLEDGTELRILSNEVVEANGYIWRNVQVTETEQEGWVADDYLVAA